MSLSPDQFLTLYARNATLRAWKELARVPLRIERPKHTKFPFGEWTVVRSDSCYLSLQCTDCWREAEVTVFAWSEPERLVRAMLREEANALKDMAAPMSIPGAPDHPGCRHLELLLAQPTEEVMALAELLLLEA